MIRLNDIHSLTDFQRNARDHIRNLKETGRPEVLTVNGKAELVIQDAEAYQRLLDIVAHAETIVGIHRGLKGVADGTGEKAEAAFDSLRRELGIQEPG